MTERRRAQHRKSRRGCLQCKQRHTKCDETRPECVNCTVVGRQCKYAEVQVGSRGSSRGRSSSQLDLPTQGSTQAFARGLSVDYPSPASTSIAAAGQLTATTASPVSPAWSHTSALSRLTHTSPNTTQNEGICMLDASDRGNADQVGSPPPQKVAQTGIMDNEVNVNHMELLLHFFLSKAAAYTESERQSELLDLATNLIMQKSMGNATLLHQVLAISARYLSIKRPERHDFYSQQAVQLQSRAIELFNQTSTFDESNCEALLLFSSLLNRQVLADALGNREGDFPTFLDRFLLAGHLQRGIKVVSHETWPMLLNSDLKPLLQSCDANPVNRQGKGSECTLLRQLIVLSSTLDPMSREACRSAIHFLQIGFDDVKNPIAGYAAYNMIYSWFIFVPDHFINLLTQHKPEALAILAFYAVLLHLERDNWVVGDAGAFLLRGLSEYLGIDWGHWLEWPLQQLAESQTP